MAEGSTQPPHATRFIETTRGVLSYSQLAPLLAEQVLRLLENIEEENYSGRPLDEALLLEFHREICIDLTPDLAGLIRRVEVRVGGHQPPPPHQLAQLLRDYSGDLQARLDSLKAPDDPLLLETLAFAEGRLLFIHPFTDFNGRVTRLFLAEILRRLNLPPVELAPFTDPARGEYLRSLRAADSLDWRPLTVLWRQRLEAAASGDEP
ncbi:MAG: Fic family protein [Verrucomicrobia bacterium]|nr:Fic family protein [Verrucomicrobiota bacterium]